MMTIELFFLSLVLTLSAVILPLQYLRPITRGVLLELCDRSEMGAEFWLRTANVLAISGALMLVLMFGKTGGDWVDAMRFTLILSLAGVFVTVLFVSSNVWRRAMEVNKAHAKKEAVAMLVTPMSSPQLPEPPTQPKT